MFCRAFGVLLIGTSISGCYQYIPVELDQVPLDTHVNVTLSTEGQVDLRERAGLDRRELRGILVERSADEVLIAVPSTSAFPGEGPFYQRLDIRTQDVLGMDERVLDKARVVALTVASVAATLVAIRIIVGDRGLYSRSGGGPGPPEHVTGWRFNLPLPIQLGIP